MQDELHPTVSTTIHEGEIHDVKYEERRKVEEGWLGNRIDIAAGARQGLGIGVDIDVNVVAAMSVGGLEEGSMRGMRCCEWSGGDEAGGGYRQTIACGHQITLPIVRSRIE